MAQEKLVKIKLKDIRSNPNRDLKFNPFNEEKIAALISSIEETGFWTNVIVRPDPKDKGKYQQAYGHHRMEAARRCKVTEAEFVVRDLDDQTMLKMMELENQEDYRYSPLSLLESVKAVVKALAEGSIAPFHKPYDGEIDPKDPYRGAYKEGNKWKAQYKLSGKSIYVGAFETREEAAKAFREATKGMLREDGQDFRKAPLFSPGCSTTALPVENLYTPLDVAKFLGKTKTNGTQSDTNIRTALDALYLLEVKALKVSDIRDLNWSALSQVGIWPSETRGSS